MHVTILQENLLRALARCGRILSSRPQLPVLQNVLLAAQDKRFRVTTTNLETAETVFLGGKIEKDGGLCVSARLLTELVASLPPEAVSLVVRDGALHVSCGRFSAVLPGIAATEFPPISSANERGAAPFDRRELAGALSLVLFAAATDEGRPILTGVKISSDTKGATFAATDGYRLSVKRAAILSKEEQDMVVPSRALGEAAKTIAEEKEDGKVALTRTKDGQLALVVGDTHIVTRLIDGEYPDYEKIIPKTYNTRALLDKDTFFRAVRSAAVFARDNANIIKLSLDKQKIVVSANTPQVGENTVELEAKIDGDGGEIAFNSRFLTEFLANYPGDELLFEMTGSLNPGLFRPVKDDTFVHVIMPVRVSPG